MPEASQQKFLASYGRRRGRRLRPQRQELMDELLPQLRLTPEGNGVMEWWSNTISPSPHHPTTPPPLFLEIGFGGGEHLAHQARLHPEACIIGCEPYINGVAGLLAHIRDNKLFNIRILQDDARPLVEKLPDACLGKVFILYPDPWPKARHHKRRLISTEFLNQLARVMKPGAELRLATDHSDYCTWMLEHLLSHPAFTWAAKTCEDWRKPWPDWIPTRYEQKRLAGQPTYLTFTRNI